VNRGTPSWLFDYASVVPVLEQPFSLLKQESRGQPQSLGQEHRVGLAGHVGVAPALHLPDEPAGDA
jgi:hypothetical protein